MGEDAKKSKLDDVFRRVVVQMAAELEAFAAGLRNQSASPAVPQRACEIAHSLHGAGSLYGYSCVSEMGASLEKLTNALRAGKLAPSEPVITLVESCANALRALVRFGGDGDAVKARIYDLGWQCECELRSSASESARPPQTP